MRPIVWFLSAWMIASRGLDIGKRGLIYFRWLKAIFCWFEKSLFSFPRRFPAIPFSKRIFAIAYEGSTVSRTT